MSVLPSNPILPTPQHLLDMLAPHPHLLQPVITALHGEREAVTKFFLDPSTDPVVIQLVQNHDDTVPILVPLLQASRACFLCSGKCSLPPVAHAENYKKRV